MWPFLAKKKKKKKSMFGLGGLSEDSVEFKAFLQGTELPRRGLGGFCFRVKPAVVRDDSDPEFKSLPYHPACCPLHSRWPR